MYAGNVVETGRVADVFSNPRHPYTKGLLESVPVNAERGGELNSIPGSPPELHNIPPGCVYQSRCPMAQEICRAQRPELLPINDDGGKPGRHSVRPATATALPVTVRAAACHFSEELDND
jgi:oligopeptide transport system ATP-binding protein